MRTSQSIQIVGTRIHIISAPLPQHSYFFFPSEREANSWTVLLFRRHLFHDSSKRVFSFVARPTTRCQCVVLPGRGMKNNSIERNSDAYNKSDGMNHSWSLLLEFFSFLFSFFFRSPLVLLLSIII